MCAITAVLASVKLAIIATMCKILTSVKTKRLWLVAVYHEGFRKISFPSC